MFYLNCFISVLIILICEGITIRREYKDISHIFDFEKQQGFSNMGRLRQGKEVLDAKVRSQHDDSNSNQTNDFTDILQSPFLFLNYFFENGIQNDTLKDSSQDKLKFVETKMSLLDEKLQDQNTINKKTHAKKKGHISDYYIDTGFFDQNDSTPIENFQIMTGSKTESTINLSDKEDRPRKPKRPKKINKNEHDISTIEYEVTKLWCTTRIKGDAITKILECFTDKISIQKIKYGAKVLLINKRMPKDEINFFRCLSKIKTNPENTTQTILKKQMKDCFTVHKIKIERLYDYLLEYITKDQDHDLKLFIDCLSEVEDEYFKQHTEDCIDVNPVLFKAIDRIKRAFLKGSTSKKPKLLKAGKSFTSNLKDVVASNDDNDAQMGVIDEDSDSDRKKDISHDGNDKNDQDDIFSVENKKDEQKDVPRHKNVKNGQKQFKFNFKGDFVIEGDDVDGDEDDVDSYSSDEVFDA